MPRKGSPQLTEDEMKQLEFSVKNILGVLNYSLSELERKAKLPSKSLTSGFNNNGDRKFTQSHFEKLLDYVSNHSNSKVLEEFSRVYVPLEEVVEEKVVVAQKVVVETKIEETPTPKNIWGDLSEDEIENKVFWIEEIKKAKSNL